MTTRIAIAYTFNDADWLGGRNYFANLIRAAHRAGRDRGVDFEFVLFTGERISTSLPGEFAEMQVVRSSMLDRMQPWWLARQVTKRYLGSDPLFRRLLKQHRIDLLTHGEPLGKHSLLKVIGWLFDFQFMHMPEYWDAKQLARVRKRYADSCEQCDGLVVSSAAALADLQKFKPSTAQNRFVLRFVSSPVDFGKLKSLQAITASYELPQDYYYVPNQFWKHKNHRVLIESLAILSARGLRPTFVCTGSTKDPRSPDHYDRLMHQAHDAGVSERFRVLGVIPYADTQSLMANCRAVINPSFFEGWSTTVEEAKTLGKQLIVSDLPVHREQCGELGQYFDPLDARQLADRVAAMSQSPVSNTPVTELARSLDERTVAFGSAYLDIVSRTLEAAPAHRPRV